MFRPLRSRALPFIQRTIRSQSTSAESPGSPILEKMRSDMKDAMRAKNRPRLEVLRGVISEVNNAAKTTRPVETDMNFIQLIRKRSDLVKAARDEYVQQNRNDLKEKAEAELGVLAEYSAMMEPATTEEIEKAVSYAIEKLKSEAQKPVIGQIIKLTLSEEGPLRGKYVPGSDIAQIAKKTLESN